MKKEQIWPSFTVFALFCIAALLFLLSPVILKIEIIKGFIQCFLMSIGSHKDSYLSAIGGIIGTGLAISSALVINKIQELRNEDIKLLENQNQIKSSAHRLEKYLINELNKIYCVWIWTRFDYSVHNEEGSPYKLIPYKSDISYVNQLITSIDKKLSIESSEILYQIHSISDQLNYYIDMFNTSKIDIPIKKNYGGLSTSPNLSEVTEIRTNSHSVIVFEAIKKLLEDNAIALYVTEDKKLICESDYSNELRRLRDQRNVIIDSLVRKNFNLLENEAFEPKQQIVKFWIENINSPQIPDEAVDQVKRIIDFDDKIAVLKKTYSEAKSNYINKTNVNRYSLSVTTLLNEINGIKNS